MQRYCLALDLKDDPQLIAEYEKYHEAVWPEILQSLRDSGIERMEIYRVMNRLFLVMEVNDTFSLEKKAAADAANPKVQEWEQLMWKYQEALPIAAPGQKWVKADKVFSL
ncbi:L-rhamnose mutarotase [Chitinophaga japonensis]|uniref:L-rhamnose mutarotase n=1 Tax=Chitinophaga japonensis TaxID=104662 RepID=A0A562T5F1_CHIJA|nr:L-rhamnose mutarotase [Chitinophaga japonensis]TWI88498.1 L-rhamnose mutarotase [Chitinophaga japonensis]